MKKRHEEATQTLTVEAPSVTQDAAPADPMGEYRDLARRRDAAAQEVTRLDAELRAAVLCGDSVQVRDLRPRLGDVTSILGYLEGAMKDLEASVHSAAEEERRRLRDAWRTLDDELVEMTKAVEREALRTMAAGLALIRSTSFPGADLGSIQAWMIPGLFWEAEFFSETLAEADTAAQTSPTVVQYVALEARTKAARAEADAPTETILKNSGIPNLPKRPEPPESVRNDTGRVETKLTVYPCPVPEVTA